ncbi:MAG TPA: MATE family efflux transporter [Candidatus Scybalocola faecipullorum]|nr:MATE family efflux transporter [Candidatus Scybalocola faecipullorum]
MKKQNNLGRDNVGTLVWKIAVPSMLAQFVSVLYSVVDRMYIGNIPEIGSVALAGVGVCGPIVTMISSFASLIGVGGSPLMSIRMGEGKETEAKQILANCFMMLCVLSVILTVAVMAVREPMLYLFGASSQTYPYADAYFSTYLIGTIFALLSTGMNQFIICQGFAKTGMFSVMIGAVFNIILDPVFIFVFNMGVRGAAIATVLSQIASCIFVLGFLFSKTPPIRISFGGYKFWIMKRVLTLGFTPFIIIAIDNVMIIAMNAVLQHYGGPVQGDILITCATIVQSFMLLVTMPLGGISGGTQPILAYNYGAGQTLRVMRAQKYIFGFCLGYTALMMVAAWLGGPVFVRLFTGDAGLAGEAVWAIRVSTLALLPLGIQYEIVDGFTAIAKVGLSLPLSFFRKLVYFIALFLIPVFFEAKMIFFSETISDIIGPLVSIIVYRFVIKKIMQQRIDEVDAVRKLEGGLRR